MVGANAFATATVGGGGGGSFTPSGSVTYSLFTGGSCAGSALSTDTEALTAATCPTRARRRRWGWDLQLPGRLLGRRQLRRVDLAVRAVHGRTVGGRVSAPRGRERERRAWTASEANGSAAIDTATVSGRSGFVPTGSVTYSCSTVPAAQATRSARRPSRSRAATCPTRARPRPWRLAPTATRPSTPATPTTRRRPICEPFVVMAPLTSDDRRSAGADLSFGDTRVTGGRTGGSTAARWQRRSAAVAPRHDACAEWPGRRCALLLPGSLGGPGIADCAGSVATAPRSTPRRPASIASPSQRRAAR